MPNSFRSKWRLLLLYCVSLPLPLLAAGCSSDGGASDVPLTVEGKIKAIDEDSSLKPEEKEARKAKLKEFEEGLQRMKQSSPPK